MSFGISNTAVKQLLAILKDDFTLSTWLYVGALIQSVLFLVYPYRVVVLPCILVISYRIVRVLLMQSGTLADPLLQKSIIGRTTAQVLNPDGTIPQRRSGNQVVVFILASSPNTTAKGRLRVDNGREIGRLFTEMWVDLAKNREKWGYLGKTSTLYSSDEPHSNVTSWITYFRDLEGLHAFARSSTHMAALRWWNEKPRPEIGIMHETYVVPAGNWEIIHGNMRDFGLAQSKQTFTNADGEQGVSNGRIPVRGSAYGSMKTRMGNVIETAFDSKWYRDEDNVS